MRQLPDFFRVAIVAVLIAIQGIGPLLHAHMGTPRQTGFHFDASIPGLYKVVREESRAVSNVAVSANGFAMSVDEPLSISVEKGVVHQLQALFFDPEMAEALLALFASVLLLAAWVAHPIAYPETPHLLRWKGGSSHPPPAHAPPHFS